ncbi:LacI family DNA-binding transcriptional regulator [Carboxydochorda subterranea]|uniref:LacI family DNA-binding transcriptional regulator n=1 Tax=Carboxydichorda subterranea TaxID=3109565 RepID=A0ABZ1BZB6_9FIRM|nr:LacI family DNA-binding transcriptional regulator [Limnochorda sp. L945t]WRP17910.1 LacI family DNA-binding transcriptional regulator [Limnochorda sp. L945t]
MYTNRRSPRRHPSLKDVALAARVSHATVSRALRNVGRVAPQTRAAVLAAADRLGYTPNLIARGLKNGATGMLSALVPGLSGPPVSDMMSVVNEELERAGIALQIHTSSEDAERQLEKLRLIRGSSDGVFFVPTSDLLVRGRDDLVQATTRQVQEMGVPVVFVDRYLEVPGAGVVCTDNETAAYEVAMYLISLGHRSIGYLTGPAVSSVRERLQGFRRAMAEAGLAYDESHLESLVADSYEAGAEAALRLLRRAQAITALVTYNHNATVGTVVAARRLGLEIPGDLSLVAFDDVREVSAIQVPLTYVEQDVVSIGRHAAQLMLDMLRGGPPRQIRVQARLVVRQSAAAVR